MLPSGSIRVTLAARVSVNSTLPSGMPTGPSAPSNPVLINTIGVPAATTPGMAVSTTRLVGTGRTGAAPSAAGAAAGSAGVAADSVPAGEEQATANRLAARIGTQGPAINRRMRTSRPGCIDVLIFVGLADRNVPASWLSKTLRT